MAWEEKSGKCLNSEFLNGLEVEDAIKRAIQEIESKGGFGKTQYRLRDAIFGRQRYWGEPIPIYYKEGIPCAMEENELPLVLPEVDKYLPTEDGEPPLARATNWKHQEKYEYEKTTMPGWAGSSWYYLRYMDAQNKNEFVSKEAVNYWKDVDLYIGGSEHATGHLLYVRFWTKFLFDLNLIPIIEPAKKLINQGMVQGRSSVVYIVNWMRFIDSNTLSAEMFGGKHREEFDIIVSKKYGEPYHQEDLKKQEGFPATPQWLTETLKNITTKEKYLPCGIRSMNIEISLVDNDILDINAFKKWRPEFSNAYFIGENGKIIDENNKGEFVCGVIESEKMSKSKFNVVTPDEICDRFGADTLRMYEMFLGPLEMSKPWNTNGISGVFNFLNRFWRLFHIEHKVSNIEYREEYKISDEEPSKAELKILHKTIKKIQEDIENYSFNTSVSAFMICTNELTELKCNKRKILEPLVILLSPFAPHIAEELWGSDKLGHTESISSAEFPKFNEAFTVDESFAYPISFNGKMRFKLELSLSLSPAKIEKEVLAFEQTKKYLEGKQPKKVIVVPKKIVNIVV